MKKHVFHLISNAHLDPVWLWDRYEGLQEGLATVNSALELMEEFPELTFSRGESCVYEYVERCSPAAFGRIRRLVEEGRWEIVGGTYLQNDTNLTGTEAFCRQFMRGQRYFRSRFGFTPRVAWYADSFGHSGGMPEILLQGGVDSFCFTRPMEDILHIPENAFKWIGFSGAGVTGYRPKFGWYGAERKEMTRRLDGVLAAAQTSAFRNSGVFFGLGDHGGGPVREQMRDMRAWAAAHPEVEMRFSSMQALIDSVRAENAAGGGALLPEIRGELNFTLRGCYSSAQSYKSLYRRCEALQTRADAARAAVGALLADGGACAACGGGAEDDARCGVLFGAFHDLLPGTSIESGFDNQTDWLHAAAHHHSDAERAALLALAARMDTRRSKKPAHFKPGSTIHLLWNPNPWPVRASVDLESCLDARPIPAYEGRRDEIPLAVRDWRHRAVPFQRLPTENLCLWPQPWRARVAVTQDVPALGWKLMELGWEDAPSGVRADSTLKTDGKHTISNDEYEICAKPGAAGVRITHCAGARGSVGTAPQVFPVSLMTVLDDSGSWGGSDKKPEHTDLREVTAKWRVDAAEAVERGPERATLAVALSGGGSRVKLWFSLTEAQPAVVQISGRLFLDERLKRVKMAFGVKSAAARYDVPGGVAERAPSGEVPGGRWVQLLDGARAPAAVLASDSHYCCNHRKDALEITLSRSAFYAHSQSGADAGGLLFWREPTDRGELRFRMAFSADPAANPVRIARELEAPVQAFPVVASGAEPAGAPALPRSGSIAALMPERLAFDTLKTAEDGGGDLILRVHEQGGRDVKSAALKLLGKKVKLGKIPALAVRTFRISGGVATPVGASEE